MTKMLRSIAYGSLASLLALAAAQAPSVTIENGTVVGSTTNKIDSFSGIVRGPDRMLLLTVTDAECSLLLSLPPAP